MKSYRLAELDVYDSVSGSSSENFVIRAHNTQPKALIQNDQFCVWQSISV